LEFRIQFGREHTIVLVAKGEMKAADTGEEVNEAHSRPRL
jgi:hypothetical protein